MEKKEHTLIKCYSPLYNFSRPIIVECCKEECSPYKVVKVEENKDRFYLSLHFIYRGKGRVFYRGSEQVVSTGDLFMVPPKEAICYEADKQNPFCYYWIVLAGQAAYEMMEEINLSKECICVQSKGDRGAIIDLFGKINKSYLERPQADYERLGYFYLLFDKLKTGISLRDDYNHGHYINQIEILVGCSYMNSRFTVEDICKNLNLSLSYINRIFKKEKKLSPKKYLTHVRLKNAEDLLVQTDRPVSDIARLTGFEDPKYFARVFKENFGCTASEYRQKNFRTHPKKSFSDEKLTGAEMIGSAGEYSDDQKKS